MTSAVSIVRHLDPGQAKNCCSLIESKHLRYRRMEMGDVGSLWDLFRVEANYRAYGSTESKKLDRVAAIVEMDARRPYYTGLLVICRASERVLGRAAIGSGYSSLRDEDYEGSYRAAPIEEGGGKGPAEVQIGDFLTTEESKLEPTGRSREELFGELVMSMIFAATSFIKAGELQNGQPVKRVTITLIEPETSGFEGTALAELKMKKAVIRGIFGEAMGILSPLDKRNYSAHVRNVYGCDVERLDELLARNGLSLS